MPIFPYYCKHGHETEHLAFRLKDAPATIDCPFCREKAKRGIGLPNFSLSWAKPAVDTWKDAWEDTPLEDGSELQEKMNFKKSGAKPRTFLGGEK